MDLGFYSQSFIYGIFVGALYGLAAVGFSFIFGIMRILNIAHGELVMVGGYSAFTLFALYHIDPFLSLPLVAAALFVLGLVLYRVFFSRVIRYREELRTNNSLLISFGLIMILEQAALLTFSADERSVSPPYAGMSLKFMGLQLPYLRLGVLAISFLLIFGLHLFLQKTYIGKAIRATAENWESAVLMGIPVNRVYMFSFAFACALAGVAGSMVLTAYSINPAVGLDWILKAMVVSVLAGMGNVGGAFIAGILLGVVEAISAVFLGPYMQVVGLAIFLLVLMLRPQGLFGRQGVKV